MAEMSTLLGYEIVDKKARELIAGLEGGGTGGGSDIEVPTKVSELENDAGYIATDDLPDEIVTFSMKTVDYTDSIYEAANIASQNAGKGEITKSLYPFLLVYSTNSYTPYSTVYFIESFIDDFDDILKLNNYIYFAIPDTGMLDGTDIRDISIRIIDGINKTTNPINKIDGAGGIFGEINIEAGTNRNTLYVNFDLLDIKPTATREYYNLISEEPDYGTAGQRMITNGDGTVGFAYSAGSGTDIELTDDLGTDDSSIALSAKGGKLLQDQIDDIYGRINMISAEPIYEAAGVSIDDNPYLSVLINPNGYMAICFAPTISANGSDKIQFNSPMILYDSNGLISIADLSDLNTVRDKAVEVISSNTPKTSGSYSVTYGVETAYYYTNFDPTDYGVTNTGNHWMFSSDFGTDVTVPTKVSELENDAGYITVNALSDIESRLTALENIDIAEGGAY